MANGDAAAARDLIDRIAPRLMRHLTRMLGNPFDAEEVVQETMIRLWRIAPAWRQGEANVSTWAFRVAVNLATDRLRKSRPLVSFDAVAEPAATGTDTVPRMTDEARIAALDAALSRLPERQRTAVSLRHIEEMSNSEIAEIMDISVEAVESLTARGKRALAAQLKRQRKALGYQDE